MISGARQVWYFLRLSRPIFLLGGALVYGLGASVARYLGRPIDANLYLLGQGIVTFIQLTTHYLNEYFDGPADLGNPNRTTFSGGSGVLGPDALPRRTAIYAAITTLTIAATLVSVLLASGGVPAIAWLILILAISGALLYSLPPVRLVSSGYGEIVASVVVAGLVPSFAYTLQTGELHRLLIMATTPLMAIHLAMLVAFELPDYASDAKHGKATLLVRLGWAHAMSLHDFALLFAFASLLGAFLYGLPRQVALGSLISIPLAAAQVWQMWRIRQGYPPRWRALTVGGAALFSLTAYLELAGFLLS